MCRESTRRSDDGAVGGKKRTSTLEEYSYEIKNHFADRQTDIHTNEHGVCRRDEATVGSPQTNLRAPHQTSPEPQFPEESMPMYSTFKRPGRHPVGGWRRFFIVVVWITTAAIILLLCSTTTSRILIVHAQSDGGTITTTVDGRFSYSLTTFNPAGKLIQVERALLAASLGPPLVAVVVVGTSNDQVDDDHSNPGASILLAAPQLLPSPLLRDDGTSRFAQIAPHLVMGHTGIAADGRLLLDLAQQFAVSHTYTYDEPIPVGLFLEELSLLMQECTMKQGIRPFGVTLLVGYIPPPPHNNNKPRLFRIDCSGSVEELGSVAIVNGNFRGNELRSKLLDLSFKSKSGEGGDGATTLQSQRTRLSQILQEALQKSSSPSSSSNRSDSSTSSGGRYASKARNGSSKKRDGNDDDVVVDDDEADNDETDDELSDESVDVTKQKIKLPLRIISGFFSTRTGLVVGRRSAPPTAASSFNDEASDSTRK